MYIDNNDILTLLLDEGDEEDFMFSHLKPKNNNKRTDDTFKFRETEGFYEVLTDRHFTKIITYNFASL